MRHIFNVFFVWLITIALVACQARPIAEQTLPGNTKVQGALEAQGKELFVVKQKISYLYRLNVNRLCREPLFTQCIKGFDYQPLLGMQGYFLEQPPIKTDDTEREFYAIAMQNGQQLYYMLTKASAGKYSDKSPISFVSHKYASVPLVPGSQIRILSEFSSFNQQYVRLSDGRRLEKQQLMFIRDICRDYHNPALLAKILLDMQISYSKIYQSYQVQTAGIGQASSVGLVIGSNNLGPWLRFRISHIGVKKLSLNGFSIMADQLQWRSAYAPFMSDKFNHKVIESFEITANDGELTLVNALVGASRARLRLYGKTKSVLQVLKAKQKEQLSQMLKLFQLMEQNFI